MQKTINPDTQRPYTISMIERLMHEIHFAVDPNSNSKKQASEVMRELQKHFPIKHAPMRLRLIVPQQNISSLSEKLNEWGAKIVSNDEFGNQISITCEMEPSFFRDCDSLLRNLQGRLELFAVNVHVDSDNQVDNYEDTEDEPSSLRINSRDTAVSQLSEKLEKQNISAKSGTSDGNAKQTKCSTCNALVGDSKQYREHCKSEWHKHNLKRKTRQLPPLTAEECMGDLEINDSKGDLNEYSF